MMYPKSYDTRGAALARPHRACLDGEADGGLAPRLERGARPHPACLDGEVDFGAATARGRLIHHPDKLDGALRVHAVRRLAFHRIHHPGKPDGVSGVVRPRYVDRQRETPPGKPVASAHHDAWRSPPPLRGFLPRWPAFRGLAPTSKLRCHSVAVKGATSGGGP